MNSGRIYPPWDEKTIAGLNRWQANPNVHPFTCPCGADLVAGRNGWVCSQAAISGCGHWQGWAWTFMVDGGPPEELYRRMLLD